MIGDKQLWQRLDAAGLRDVYRRPTLHHDSDLQEIQKHAVEEQRQHLRAGQGSRKISHCTGAPTRKKTISVAKTATARR